MKFSTRPRVRRFAVLFALLPLGLASLQCYGGQPWAPPVPRLIHDFVAGQHLPALESIRVEKEFPELGLTFFRASFGPPQDCPSGCFYDFARGIQLGSKIGWYAFEPVNAPERYGLTGLTSFPVAPADEALFRDAVWLQLDPTLLWGALLPKLAREPGTPEEVLLRIAARLQTLRLPYVALALLANPTIESHPAVLQQLACLPEFPGDPLAAPRAQARTLLGDAFQGCPEDANSLRRDDFATRCRATAELAPAR